MSIVVSIVGALMGLAARGRPPGETALHDKSHPRFIAGYDAGLSDGRRDTDRLKREVERLERRFMATWNDLVAERERAASWRQEALRLRHADQPGWAIAQQQMAAARNAQYGQLAAAYMSQAQWPHCDCAPTRQRALTGRAERLTNP